MSTPPPTTTSLERALDGNGTAAATPLDALRLPRERWLETGRIDMGDPPDRKSTRLNSSHSQISYAAFCLQNSTREVIERRGEATLDEDRRSDPLRQLAQLRERSGEGVARLAQNGLHGRAIDRKL